MALPNAIFDEMMSIQWLNRLEVWCAENWPLVRNSFMMFVRYQLQGFYSVLLLTIKLGNDQDKKHLQSYQGAKYTDLEVEISNVGLFMYGLREHTDI